MNLPFPDEVFHVVVECKTFFNAMIRVLVIGETFSNFDLKGIYHFHVLVERGKYRASNQLE